MRRLIVLPFSILLIGLLTACGGVEDSESASTESVETNEEQTESNEVETQEESKEDGGGKIEVNETYSVNGLDITIENIEITDRKLKVGMTIANTEDTTKTFYPDQGAIVIGSTQIDANMFETEGDISGDIFGGVEKSGTVVFYIDESGINFDEVDEITLRFGDVFDDETFNAKEFTETISLK